MLEIVIHPQESACVILVEMELTALVSCFLIFNLINHFKTWFLFFIIKRVWLSFCSCTWCMLKSRNLWWHNWNLHMQWRIYKFPMFRWKFILSLKHEQFLLINTLHTVNKSTYKNTIFHHVPISNVHKPAALVSIHKIAVYISFSANPLYFDYLYICCEHCTAY